MKLAVGGLEILAAVAGGLAVFAGIKKMVSEKKPVAEGQVDETNEEFVNTETGEVIKKEVSTGERILNGIQLGQAVLGCTINVIRNISLVAQSINNIFNRDYYSNTMIGDSSVCTGYFGPQMIPGSYYNPNVPCNVPLRGTDGGYVIRRGNSVYECYS